MTENQKGYKRAVIEEIQRKYEVDWITASKMLLALTNIDDSLRDYPEETMHDDIGYWVEWAHEAWISEHYPFL